MSASDVPSSSLLDSVPPHSDSARTRRSRSLRRHMFELVLAALLPLLLLAAGLTAALVVSERNTRERAYLDSVRALSNSVDVEVERSLAALRTLALHDSLQRNDLVSFYRVANQTLGAMGIWSSLLVAGPQGEHMLNTGRPLGDVFAPLLDSRHLIETARTGQPYVSNALTGTVQTGHFIYLAVPVAVQGVNAYVLAASVSHSHWTQWLQRQAGPGAVVALIDREKMIFGRSHDAERLVGATVKGWYAQELERRSEGSARGPGLLDEEVLATFVRSARTGWTVNLVTPVRELAAPVRRAALTLAAGGAVALAIALALAFWRAQVLTRGIQRLSDAQRRLRSGRSPVDIGPDATGRGTKVRELDAALATLQETAEALANRSQRIEHLQQALKERAEAAEAEVRRKDEFVATLAHELRNPLAPIRNAVEVLKRSDPAAPSNVRARAVIERQLAHVTRLVDDLLDMARINTGKITLRLEPVDLAEVLRQAVEAAESALEQAGVALQVTEPQAPLSVHGDAARLIQVVVNLLTNAAKFTPAGGHARLVARREGAWAVIEVADDGIGIEPADALRIFEMFSQVTSAMDRTVGGLGIGLALVRGLVQAHRGEVAVASEGAQRGSTFTVRLPLKDS